MRRISAGAQRLQTWLAEQGWTQFRLCGELGIQPSVVSGWLTGRTRPCLTHAIRLETLADIPPRMWVE